MRSLKGGILRVCRFLGLFALSSRLFRRRLQILCYHGFEVSDECRFRPHLFISASTFAARLRRIGERGLKVLPLEHALRHLRDGSLPDNAVVITIDDGFASTSSVAAPLLRQFAMPATVYVTTYYAERNVPIFRLAVQYVFWRASPAAVRELDVRALGLVDAGRGVPDAANVLSQVIRHGEELDGEEKRQALLLRLGAALGVDVRPLHELRLLSLMSVEEVKALAEKGFDIQLHTHRHRFPKNDETAARLEVEQNRAKLEALTGRAARHFCYPSGEFSSVQWPWLESLGIESATTCLPGSNAAATPRYGLKRFLDSEAVPGIEFDAELSGFGELTRAVKALVTLRMLTRSNHYESQNVSR